MKWATSITIAAYLALVVAPRGAWAAEPPTPALDTSATVTAAQGAPTAAEIAPLKKGASAPFLGLLVPESRFIKLLEAENEVRELRAKLAAAERTGELVEKAYLRRLEQATAPLPWYESSTANRWLGFGLGVAVTGLATWGAIELSNATR